jgi:hypothetical protein
VIGHEVDEIFELAAGAACSFSLAADGGMRIALRCL